MNKKNDLQNINNCTDSEENQNTQMQSKRIDNPYDKGYKRIFSIKKNFLDFIKKYISLDWMMDLTEKDLELRGTGEFFGTKQHGLPEFKVANLFEDMEILKQAQLLAIKIIEEDPELKLSKNALLKQEINKKFNGKIEI